jgi:hypothetical protein
VGYASIDIGKVLEKSKEPIQKFDLPLRPRPETKKKTAEKIKGTLIVTLKFPDTVSNFKILFDAAFVSNSTLADRHILALG